MRTTNTGRRMAAIAYPFLAVAIFFSANAMAQDGIGNANAIENRVTGTLSGAPRLLSVPNPVFRNERITTAADAAGRFRFVDGSDLRVGPAASIALDASVFSGRPNSAMTLAKGALRFFSGNGPEGSYRIRTPVGTIGLRGTTVDVVVRGGRTFVTLVSGAVRVCANSGRCVDLTSTCESVAMTASTVSNPQSGLPNLNSVCRSGLCGANPCGSDAGGVGPGGGGGNDNSGRGGGGNGGGGGGGGGGGKT